MRWHRRILGFCLIIFAFELGLFLLIFPLRSAWSMNWIPVHSARLAPSIWITAALGVLSGLGLYWVALFAAALTWFALRILKLAESLGFRPAAPPEAANDDALPDDRSSTKGG